MSATETTIPIAEEDLSVHKRQVVTGRVHVRTETEIVNEVLRLELSQEEVEVSHVPINRVVDAAPPVRTEDGVTIIPVLEERLVVEKRLVLAEEIHVSRRTTTKESEIPVERRRQRAVVERLPPDPLPKDIDQ